MRQLRGQSLTIESIILGIGIALAVMFAAEMALGYFRHGAPTTEQAYLSLSLCNNTIFVDNVGPIAAQNVVIKAYSGGNLIYTDTISSLSPGQYEVLTISSSSYADEAVATGTNLAAVVVPNSCGP